MEPKDEHKKVGINAGAEGGEPEALIVEEGSAEEAKLLVNDDIVRGDTRATQFPPVLEAAAEGKELDEFEIVDATEWLFASEEEQAEENVPTTCRIEIAPGKKIEWKLRPLSDEEFTMCRKAAMGTNREQARKLKAGQLSDLVNDKEYNRLVVALATVSPDLEAAAKLKQVHPTTIVEHRFRFRPGWISELAGVVNDISGYDPTKIETVSDAVGNS